ncbi:MAG TPA: helix-turn-helix transcriptional regulator [Vicinamibacterales bacterium]|nr:helix-turn-helix transcriptional regulator [Vicinamibacterales bacterium]
MRHRPDGPVLVRTNPVTFLHPHTLAPHEHEWDQLTYAASGVMRVETADASWMVPPHCAVWVPAGVAHAEQMHAPVSVRTLYFAPRLAKTLPRECRTVNIPALLRELILHVSRRGALDRRKRADANLIGVLLDELSRVTAVPLQLPLPRDTRALRFATAVQAKPADRSSLDALARRAGASRRTLERLFVADTGMRVGDWRRRARLLHAVRRLAEGESVGNAAAESGYASVSAFVAVFRKTFGTTPGRYA